MRLQGLSMDGSPGVSAPAGYRPTSLVRRLVAGGDNDTVDLVMPEKHRLGQTGLLVEALRCRDPDAEAQQTLEAGSQEDRAFHLHD